MPLIPQDVDRHFDRVGVARDEPRLRFVRPWLMPNRNRGDADRVNRRAQPSAVPPKP